ncbi:helix-turn-helix domain-containing protein [Nocardia sp. NBC_00511]|uniref:helix-turn-helix domain-containing protein n=1 Tax=Nocardia sp. NBC_00511 TaxID=2903591 RepID=UPI0030E5715C
MSGDHSIEKTLGIVIGEARQTAGLTIQEAADTAGMDPIVWQMIEEGQSRIDTQQLALIAEAVRVPAEDLLRATGGIS